MMECDQSERQEQEEQKEEKQEEETQGTLSPRLFARCQQRIQHDVNNLMEKRMVSTTTQFMRFKFPEGFQTRRFIVTISPQDGLYRHSQFDFLVLLPREFPFRPPKIKCLTKILHPCINFRTGEVRLPLIQEIWRPVLTLNQVMLALQLIFVEPLDHLKANDFANPECLDFCQTQNDFALMVLQTLEGGFFFGLQWPRNRIDSPSVFNHEEKEATEKERGAMDLSESLSQFSIQDTFSCLTFFQFPALESVCKQSFSCSFPFSLPFETPFQNHVQNQVQTQAKYYEPLVDFELVSTDWKKRKCVEALNLSKRQK